MVNFQFLSGLNTIGANILDIQSDSGRVIFDYGEIMNPELGRLPEWGNPIEKTAIFISHLHIDHIGSFSQVPQEVPIYMSKDSYELYHLLLEIEEEKPIQAEVYPLDYGETKTIGDIKVTFKQSDHDIEGISSIFIETPDMKLIHSGDVRLTGNNPENVKQWVKEAEIFEPDIFLLEGTSYSFDDKAVENISEKHMYDKWHELVNQNSQEAILVNTYIRDTKRLKNLSQIVNESPRKMVLEPEFAYLLEEYLYYSNFYVLKELDSEERFKDQWVSVVDIKQNPGDYVLQNSFKNKSLIPLFKQGFYCHSNGEPLGDYDPAYQELEKILQDNELTFLDFNVSGHATKADLISIAKEVGATYTIPWHSLHPELLKDALEKAGLKTFLPEREINYSLEKLNQNVKMKSDE